MLRKSPIKEKSPIKKLSNATTRLATAATVAAHRGVHCGSQLFDSASSAVQHGTKLSHTVVNNNLDRLRSPGAGGDEQKLTPPSKSRNGGGVRDRINLFDSASKKKGDASNNVSPHRSRKKHPSRSRYNHRTDSLPGMVVYRDGEENNGREKHRQSVSKECNGVAAYEKENEHNLKDEHSSANHASSENGVKKNLSTSRRKKDKKVDRALHHDVNGDERGTTMEEGNDTSEFEGVDQQHQQQWKSENCKESSKKNDDNSTVDVARMHRNAILSSSNDNTSSSTKPTTSSFEMNKNTKKRESPTKHTLIQSPLRKHIKVVHASACSNATSTVVKEPFPLFVPVATGGASQDDTRKKNNVGHLDTLGAVMTGAQMQCSNGKDENGSTGTEDEKEKSGNEKGEALDLLTSAAFLFKHSKRNLM